MADRINPITSINKQLLELMDQHEATNDPVKREFLRKRLNTMKQVLLFLATAQGPLTASEDIALSGEAPTTPDQAGELRKGPEHALLHQVQQAASLSRTQAVLSPSSR